MPKYLKLSGRKSKTFVLQRGVDFFTQQAPKSTASPCISCYRSPIRDLINFFQKNLWSRGIERSDESLHTVKNDRLLFRKSITSLAATSWLMAQYKTYGKRSRARALMICKWDKNDIHERKWLQCAKLYSHALVYLRNQWDLVEKILTILNPVEEITQSILTEVASVSLIILFIRAFQRTLEDHDNDRGIRTMKGEMLDSLNRKPGDAESIETLVLATLLDPWFQDKLSWSTWED